MISLPRRERGAALLVSLIMLALITIIAVASFRLGVSNAQVVGNAQNRNQALAAAQGTIEQVISNSVFTTTPSNVIPQPCNGPNTNCVEVNGDGAPDVTVTVNPKCLSNFVIPNEQLNLYGQSGQDCTESVNGNSFGVQNASTGNSLCAATLWDIQATAADQTTGAQYVVDQGVAVVGNPCP